MKELWNGRFDSNEDIDLRLWQVIKEFSKESVDKRGICFVGYDTDDGVVRNLGRKGAEGGSNAIRKAMQSFPAVENLALYDYKNLKSKVLEEAQDEYSSKIAKVIEKGIFPIGLGGGHDIAYGSRGDYSVDTKDVNLEILHFKQFYKHFVFDKDEEGYVKKTQKNYMDVRVVLQLV